MHRPVTTRRVRSSRELRRHRDGARRQHRTTPPQTPRRPWLLADTVRATGSPRRDAVDATPQDDSSMTPRTHRRNTKSSPTSRTPAHSGAPDGHYVAGISTTLRYARWSAASKRSFSSRNPELSSEALPDNDSEGGCCSPNPPRGCGRRGGSRPSPMHWPKSPEQPWKSCTSRRTEQTRTCRWREGTLREGLATTVSCRTAKPAIRRHRPAPDPRPDVAVRRRRRCPRSPGASRDRAQEIKSQCDSELQTGVH